MTSTNIPEMSEDPTDDLNAAHTADKWMAQDIRQMCRVLGFGSNIAEWMTHAMSGLGMDVALARAAYELEKVHRE
jgi:hypothetical protein